MTKALVITTTGINCDLELAEAFELAGATPVSVHLNRLLHQPELVEEFDLVGLPGGFSYGDAVAAGRIAAQLIRSGLYDSLRAAVSRGVPMIAPCNGFQIAVQVGLLPDPSVSSTPRFQPSRWRTTHRPDSSTVGCDSACQPTPRASGHGLATDR